MRKFIRVSGLLLVCAIFVASCHSRQPEDTAKPEGKTLAQLCEQYRTDKCPDHHNYVEIYDTLFTPFRNKNLRILEIGVFRGMSMRLWEAYFPAAQIYGLDIESKSQYDSRRVKTLVADQGKRTDLARVLATTGGDFDLILDDGGHRMDQQQISFGTLFPTLKSGGLYIIEDIHTSFPELYPGFGVEPDGQNSTYAMIDRFVRKGKIGSKYLTEAENDYLSKNISHCAYFLRSNPFHSDMFACWKK
jgi:predicted O-methyltransferase YrrM